MSTRSGGPLPLTGSGARFGFACFALALGGWSLGAASGAGSEVGTAPSITQLADQPDTAGSGPLPGASAGQDLPFIPYVTQPSPRLQELMRRDFLDDYESNVVYGYRIVTETERYASRYSGNRLRCTNCHLNGGTQPDGMPLNIAGMYPQWRSKNGVRNGIGLRIRECFLYSLDGIMPPEDAPEVLAVAAYIHFLSEGEVIGERPEGAGVPTLPETGLDPNPARGEVVFEQTCVACHGSDGRGTELAPPLWGPESYNAGAGMSRIEKAAGFIWANMPYQMGRTLSHQQAFDVAAYLNLQLRPSDPRDGRLRKLFEKVIRRVAGWFGGDAA